MKLLLSFSFVFFISVSGWTQNISFELGGSTGWNNIHEKNQPNTLYQYSAPFGFYTALGYASKSQWFQLKTQFQLQNYDIKGTHWQNQLDFEGNVKTSQFSLLYELELNLKNGIIYGLSFGPGIAIEHITGEDFTSQNYQITTLSKNYYFYTPVSLFVGYQLDDEIKLKLMPVFQWYNPLSWDAETGTTTSKPAEEDYHLFLNLGVEISL